MSANGPVLEMIATGKKAKKKETGKKIASYGRTEAEAPARSRQEAGALNRLSLLQAVLSARNV